MFKLCQKKGKPIEIFWPVDSSQAINHSPDKTQSEPRIIEPRLKAGIGRLVQVWIRDINVINMGTRKRNIPRVIRESKQ